MIDDGKIVAPWRNCASNFAEVSDLLAQEIARHMPTTCGGSAIAPHMPACRWRPGLQRMKSSRPLITANLASSYKLSLVILAHRLPLMAKIQTG
jgi:hypothetical protein